ncbi:hypothetical protein BD626DRAFT_406222 [Schizophyllum amplum]|uniref:Borealin N-terminal domain-containing protein n=1 Tax=Schizophyllum amplum TaxID=97359 RepID=A0A550C8D0_9AGAR|nr:hypothetical protein BD626DRAFT_406222 [Auriculariopsis ampla]
MDEYTEQINKQMVLDNFEFEVEQRTEEMRRWLQLSLDQFKQHQQNLVGRIPKHVRNMTLRELRDKYNGDMQAATIGGPMERLQEVGMREREELNKKRKWAEEDNEARKNARLQSPVKKPPSNVRRTPMRHATPHKPPFVPARNPSPTKPSLYGKQRVPSSSTFNPTLNLPPKTPLYPGAGSTARPGKQEALAPPTGHTLKRTKSNILIRADPTHSRTASQNSNHDGPPLAKTSTLPVLPAAATATPHGLTRTRSVITLATTDGHVLEFDPLMNSPSDLDALDGITSSAKREARRELTRLVSATMEKWRIA